jgi:hypothetical protein
MDSATRRVWGVNRLGVWISGPLLGLLAIWLAIEALPSWECGEGKPSSPEETVLIVLTGVASLLVTAAAIVRLRDISRRHSGGRKARTVLALIGLPLIVSVLVGLVAGVVAGFIVAIISGVLFTAILLLVLLIARALGRGVEEVGALVPLYLLAAALGCYPALMLVGILGNSGLGC